MSGSLTEGVPPLVPDLQDLFRGHVEARPRGPFADMAGNEDRRPDPGGGGHPEGAPDRFPEGLTAEGPDDSRGPEDREPSHDTDPRVEALLGQVGAARDRDRHPDAPGGDLPEGRRDHPPRFRVDRRLPGGNGEAGFVTVPTPSPAANSTPSP